MENKLIFVFMGLLCLVTTQAAPTTSSQESSGELSLNGFVERLKLLALTLDEFAKLYTEVAEEGPKVFIAVLKDPKVLEVKTEAMESLTKILKEHVDKFEAAQKDSKKERIFELVEEYTDIVNNFDNEQNNLSPEATIIGKSLEKNGLVNIQNSIYERFNIFLERFSAEVEQYINRLDEKEKKNEREFISWYEKLKAEQDIDKKIEMFDNFIEVEDD